MSQRTKRRSDVHTARDTHDDSDSDAASSAPAVPAAPSAAAALGDPSAFPLELLKKLYPRAGAFTSNANADSESDSGDSDSDDDDACEPVPATASAEAEVSAAELAFRAAPASSTGLTSRVAPPSDLLSRLSAFMPQLNSSSNPSTSAGMGQLQ